MKRKLLLLILTIIAASLLSACPHRPRHGHIPKPRVPHVPRPHLPHLSMQDSVEAGKINQSKVKVDRSSLVRL